jgi:hypothetical protein
VTVRIGIDFDNTIVSYDSVFHRVALEKALIPKELMVSKLSVREHLRHAGLEQAWIEMQGYVYGARMDDAGLYPGVLDFLRWGREMGIATYIISHKTRHPFAGPQYDLHDAARTWVRKYLSDYINADPVYFELTKDAKLARINSLGCDVFIDDLPEIIESPAFPETTEGILFDPDDHHPNTKLARVQNWQQLKQFIAQKLSLTNF